MRRRVSFTALAVLVGALFAAPGSAHPVLSFDEESVVRPAPGSSVKPGKRTTPLTITLAHRYLSVDSSAGRDILNFKIRRVYHLDLKKKIYEESSLFALVGSAVLEAQHRAALSRALDAAAITPDSQLPPLVAQLFSVSVAGADVPLDTSKGDGSTLYQWKGHELLSISDAMKPLPPPYQAEYWRWVRLYYGGHPKIYGDLKDRTGVAESLRIVRSDAGADTSVTLRLKRVADTGSDSYSLEGFMPATTKDEPYRTLRELSERASAALSDQSTALLQERDAAAAAGKPFDAELAYLVQSVSTGDADSAWAHTMSDALRANADAARLAGALAAQGDEQLKVALAALAGLRSRTTSGRGYILDVFAANHQLKLKNAPEAERLFLAALAANPLLTGAWFDLGKLYYRSFRTREAWACWDAARALNPDHPFRKDVDSLERRLMAEVPQFF